MANQSFFYAQTMQQAFPACAQSLQAEVTQENVYTIWANLQRHPLYPEYRNQVHGCISVHDTAFAHYSALFMDPLASQFIETVSLSIRLAPPINCWNTCQWKGDTSVY